MRTSYAGFAKRLLILTVITGVLAAILYFLLPRLWFSPALPFLFVFYFACSMISFMILSKAMDKKFSGFVRTFMLVTALKLLLYIIIMLVYIFIVTHDAVPFLLNFFILYLIYTVFEVTRIVNLTKHAGPVKDNQA